MLESSQSWPPWGILSFLTVCQIMLVEGEEEQQSWAQLVTPGEDAAAGAAVVGDK